MKSCFWRLATALATVLLLLVVGLWAVSYWRALYMGPRDTTWTTATLSTHRVDLMVKQGRLQLLASHWAMNADPFFPEKWNQFSAEDQRRLEQRFGNQERLNAAINEFKSRTGSEEFHGWDYRTEAVSNQTVGATLYGTILGLSWDKLGTPGPGEGFIFSVPMWMLAALLAIPGAHRWARHRAAAGRGDGGLGKRPGRWWSGWRGRLSPTNAMGVSTL